MAPPASLTCFWLARLNISHKGGDGSHHPSCHLQRCRSRLSFAPNIKNPIDKKKYLSYYFTDSE